MVKEEIEYPNNCQPIALSTGNHKLINQLKTLSDALQEATSNRECGRPTRYLKLFKHLSNAKFLDNSNSSVQIYLACCLANILRVYGPEIPATEPKQLKEQYLFIFRALKEMGNIRPDGPMFKQYHYLLELICATHMFTPIADMAEEAAIVCKSLVKTVLYIPSAKEWKKSAASAEKAAKKREGSESTESDDADVDETESVQEKIKCMLLDLVQQVITEMDQVPNAALDVLFFYIINPQKRDNPESYEMALAIIKQSKTHMVPSIRAVMERSLMQDGLPEEFTMASAVNATDTGKRTKLFEIVRRLHDISYDLVETVLPFFSQQLQVEDQSQRLQATTAVGLMAASTKSRFGESPDDATWNAFLQRFRDTDTKIREECAKLSKDILLNHVQLRGQISECLERLINDSEDSVRLTAINYVALTATKRLEAISENLIVACCVRMMDKKPNVRKNTITYLLTLFKTVVTDESGDYTDSDRDSLFIIPLKALSVHKLAMRSTGLEDTRFFIERYFQSYMLPVALAAPRRVKLMAEIYRRLDPGAILSFDSIVARSSQLRRELREVLDVVSREIAKDEKITLLQSLIEKMTSSYPDSRVLAEVFKAFVNHLSTDQRSFELLEFIVADNYTSKEVNDYGIELINRTAEQKMVANINSGPGQILRRFLSRCLPVAVDNECAKELVSFVYGTVKDAQNLHTESMVNLPRHLKLLKLWVEHFAHLFSSDEIIDTLRKMLSSDDAQIIETTLEALSAILHQTSVKSRMKEAKWYSKICDEVTELITSENPNFRRVCKLSVRLICFLLGRTRCETLFDELVPKLTAELFLTSPTAANAFQALSQMHCAFPQKYHNTLMLFIMDDVKFKKAFILSSDGHPEDPEDFDTNLSMESQPWPRYTAAKVYAMKFVTRFLVHAVNDKTMRASTETMTQLKLVATTILAAFAEIVRVRGDLSGSGKQCAVERARLRAAAGACILKLCYFSAYANSLGTQEFVNLSSLITDESHCVRNYFVVRLRKGLMRKLPIEFGALFSYVGFLNANEDVVSSKESASFVEGCARLAVQAFSVRRGTDNSENIKAAVRPSYESEYVVAYAVFLLAHYPNLKSNEDVENLFVIQECLWFVLNALINAKCDIQTVYQVLETVKRRGDEWMRSRVDAPTENGITKNELIEQQKKMWAICDLGISMLLYRAKLQVKDEKKSIALSSHFFYKEKFGDPSDIYAPDELIEDEKRRNGKLPPKTQGGRKPYNNTTAASEQTRNGTSRKAKEPVRRRKESVGSGDEFDEKVEDLAPRPRSRRSRGSNPDNYAELSDNEKEMEIEEDSEGEKTDETAKSGRRRQAQTRKNAKSKIDEEVIISDSDVSGGEEKEDKKDKVDGKGRGGRRKQPPAKKTAKPKPKEVTSASDPDISEPSDNEDDFKVPTGRRRPARRVSKESKEEKSPEKGDVASNSPSSSKQPTSAAVRRIASLERLSISPIFSEGAKKKRVITSAKFATSTPKVESVPKRGVAVKRKTTLDVIEDEEEETPPTKKSTRNSSQSSQNSSNGTAKSETKNENTKRKGKAAPLPVKKQSPQKPPPAKSTVRTRAKTRK